MSNNHKLIPKRRFKEFENANAWEQRKFSDEADEIIAGGDIDKDKAVENGKYPIYANALTNDGVVGYYEDEYRVKAPAVTVTGRGEVGHAQARTIDFTPVVRLLSVKSKHDVYFLENAINNHKVVQESTGVPQLTVPQLGSYQISFPSSLDEEAKIGELFHKLDHLITLHQRKLDKLKETKIAYISEMFPKEGKLKPERRFKGYKDEWKLINLEQVATMNARIGWQNLRTSEFLKEGDYMLITGTDFDNGKVDFSTCHFVSKERYEQDTNIQVQNGSILITKDGTLGKVAYVENLEKPATLNAGVFNVRIKDQNKVDGVFLFQYLRAPFLMKYVNGRATGGTIKHLNQNILVKFPILLPEKEEQIKIGKFLTKLDNMIESQQRVLSKLIDLKNAYLSEMFV